MFWRTGDDDSTSLADKFRRVHERWLTRALASKKPIPRIPVRRVDSGGFDGLLTKPGGRDLTERWWMLAMAIADGEE